MARITGLRQGTDGAIREVELITATRRKIRRPVNLLIPLELQDSEQEASISKQKEAPPEQPAPQQPPRTQNYNLRERKATRHVHNATTAISTRTTRGVWFLFYIMILNLLNIAHGNSTKGMHVSCGDKGVMVHAQQGQAFEICAERLCEVRNMDTAPLLIKFPLDITIIDYRVLVKWNVENHLATMETRCKGLDFCSNIDCNICLSILLNPECWPLGAILTFTLCLYGIIALTYACLYVPVTIGKPIRIAGGIILKLTVILAKTIYCCIRVLRRRRTSGRNGTRMTSALATALALLYLVQTTRSCQHVNVLEQSLTTCTQENGKEICKTSLLEVLKINSFRQQACLRLVRNSTLVLNIIIRWKGLYLRCDQETLYFTRSIHLNVTDSERCPRMGSCKGEKCVGSNSSSTIAELKRGNHFPGRTGCFESCGGFGCDCFYPSSGCLFYRIFATPTDNKVFEIFRCMRWREKTMFEITIEDISAKFGRESYVVQLLPNMPITLPSLQITMTSLSLPPTPALSRTFFTDGQDTAIWTCAFSPNLLCKSREKAERMKCILADDCNCAPAEFKISCQCTTPDITKEFDQLQLEIPKKTPFWELRYQQNTSLVAKIPHMVSSEIIVELHQTWDTTVIEQGDGDCLVEDSLLQGCYHCAGGATSKFRCVSSKELFGEIMEQLQQELQETKEQLQRLRDAIPLPPPHEVHSSIVNEYLEVDRCSRTVISILRQIQLISRSQTSPDCRAHRGPGTSPLTRRRTRRIRCLSQDCDGARNL
uniref:Phlebovirus_G2 domain-containing protein n=1 Tax=Haemonchus contortus TaxID=6289 RepID=A0A7I4XXC3_HAECO